MTNDRLTALEAKEAEGTLTTAEDTELAQYRASLDDKVKENNPIQYTCIGEVLNVDENPTNFENAVVIEMDEVGNEEPRVIVISANYFYKAQMNKWLREGVLALAVLEKTVEGKTTYTDNDGKVHYHTSTTDGRCASIKRASKRMYAEALSKDIVDTNKYEDVSQSQATIIAGILK